MFTTLESKKVIKSLIMKFWPLLRFMNNYKSVFKRHVWLYVSFPVYEIQVFILSFHTIFLILFLTYKCCQFYLLLSTCIPKMTKLCYDMVYWRFWNSKAKRKSILRTEGQAFEGGQQKSSSANFTTQELGVLVRLSLWASTVMKPDPFHFVVSVVH